jgi:glucosamine--fructose-6-phosphate aminotransferase (isomerizing)
MGMGLASNHYKQSSTWNEILSQGAVWQSVLSQLDRDNTAEEILGNNSRGASWLFVGCGTSFYLAQAAASSWTTTTGESARAVPASEILLYTQLLKMNGTQSRAVVISRSGRTSEAIRAAQVLQRDLRIRTIGITCAENSELAAHCDSMIVVNAADEKSTVMTRSFTSMLISLQYLAAKQAGDGKFLADLTAMAGSFPSRIASIAEQMESFVASHSFDDYVFLGQGPFYGLAQEAALKVMEMSCAYSQFFHTLEFRHGPKSIVSPKTCLMFFLSPQGQKDEAEVLAEMSELGGITVAIHNQTGGAGTDQKIAREAHLEIPLDLPVGELASLAPYIVPGQLMGFFNGIRKGLNPDEPKNLTRVVILD